MVVAVCFVFRISFFSILHAALQGRHSCTIPAIMSSKEPYSGSSSMRASHQHSPVVGSVIRDCWSLIDWYAAVYSVGVPCTISIMRKESATGSTVYIYIYTYIYIYVLSHCLYKYYRNVALSTTSRLSIIRLKSMSHQDNVKRTRTWFHSTMSCLIVRII
jgi:hypothetical protein